MWTTPVTIFGREIVPKGPFGRPLPEECRTASEEFHNFRADYVQDPKFAEVWYHLFYF